MKEKKNFFTLRPWRSERSKQINYFSFDHDVSRSKEMKKELS